MWRDSLNKLTRVIHKYIVEFIVSGCASLVRCVYKHKHNQQDRNINIPDINNVAILVPHPDDEIIGLYHFMELIHNKAEITLFYLTDSSDINLAKKRRFESQRAIASLNVRQRIYCGLPDGRLQHHKDSLIKLLHNLSTDYDIVLSPTPNDVTPDHQVIGQLAYEIIPHNSLIWYRSTWWTFTIKEADFVVTGNANSKLNALRHFRTQSNLALRNTVILSAIEALFHGIETSSIESFRYASRGIPNTKPINTLSFFSIVGIFKSR
ncbi:MAG: PIG-L family deacetylase [Methylacidiphilales bacterium]|nr:PIG-L family deacetylase [Candidatus Methylacidiphilales bacterium]